MDDRIFNVGTGVSACSCTWGCTDTMKGSALKVDWEKNPLPHQAIEPASAACQSNTLPTELHPQPLLTILMQQKCFFFFCSKFELLRVPNLSFSGCSHVGLLFTNEEQERVSS